MIQRTLSLKIKSYLKSFPVVAVTGPRQSGKTTLLKNLFSRTTYISLEDLDIRSFAQEDPRRFLDTYKPPVIFDEIQRTPHLFSYLQTQVDKVNQAGQYILSGSHNFFLMEKIAQSLAGRVGILTLLPFSLEELKRSKLLSNNLESVIFTGFYPRIYDKKINPTDWYLNYVQTYIEKDLRQIIKITDLNLFQKFLKLCAGRTAQILNLSSFAEDCGVSHNTIRSWISILEASYIIHFLHPYYRNFNKRLIKSPKLYFYDTGLASSLLGIETADQLITHPLRGALFETMIISELIKLRLNEGKKPHGFFFRDKNGKEIDYLLERGANIKAVEIKSGQTISNDYFQNLVYWQKVSGAKQKNLFVVYGGKQTQERSSAHILSWQDLAKI